MCLWDYVISIVLKTEKCPGTAKLDRKFRFSHLTYIRFNSSVSRSHFSYFFYSFLGYRYDKVACDMGHVKIIEFPLIIGLLLFASIGASLPLDYSDLRVGNPLSLSYVWKRSEKFSEAERKHFNEKHLNDFLNRYLVFK